MPEDVKIRHYFVDEAGDLSFFDKKGRLIVADIPQVDDYFLLCIAQADRRKPLS